MLSFMSGYFNKPGL